MILSKIFEYVLYNHPIDFIDKNNIVNKFQWELRKGHSTQQTLITLVHKIAMDLDIGNHVISTLI